MTEPHADIRTVLGRHRTPASDLDDLAAGRVTPGAARRIWAVERSRRLLMLRAVTDLARRRVPAGPLPPDSAMDLLLRVDRVRPDIVAELLEHPGTGVWAVRTLERLNSAERLPAPVPPLWAEVGYLHCLAAAGALRSGIGGTIRLPVHDTLVTLPTLGRVRLPRTPPPGPPALVTLRVPAPGTGPALLLTGDRPLALPADLRRPRGPWEPLHRVAWSPRPQDPPFTLEDADPYRGFRAGPTATAAPALTGPETRGWHLLLRAAGDLLHTRHPRAAGMLAETLRVLVPLPTAPRFRTASASYNEAVGSALLSLPRTAQDLAVTLVHEARHSVLNGLLHQLALIEGEEPLLYAPWRGDPRPLSGLLHGAYAFAGVADFWRVERHALRERAAELAHFEFAVWRTAVSETLAVLLTAPGLTDAGRLFVTRLTAEAATWDQEPVPASPEALARAELADLRAVWRVRHLRPDPALADALAAARRRGADPRTAPTVRSLTRPDPGAVVPDPRGELRRLLLADPDALDRQARAAGSAVGPGAPVAADLLLLRGAAAEAVDAYRTLLAEHPEAVSAWAGLGLALRETGVRIASAALLERPEVVRALHARTAPGGDPVETADWVGRTPRAPEQV
ncbi:HEXXH motif domain-containing protein [Streptomyces griseoviridis]|uniref:HEXXH motif domain-containing protein n=1 Tax=Streptomyces TaxID=1883 RepID=UPI00247383F9|nr:HEXXH motif domain-containing protein [Streptomyces sp. MAA16]MDH6696698.1 HEXXH motif-containing protein [Streptomyces sp. MAA16]